MYELTTMDEFAFFLTTFLSTKLLSESPDAECNQGHGKAQQAQKIRPQRADSAALQHTGPYDYGKVVNGIDDREGLQPFGHGLNGVERPRERIQRRVDKEAGALRLQRRLPERG